MEEKTPVTKKKDWILAAAVLALAAVLAFGYALTHRAPSTYALVTVNGETAAMLDLKKDQEFTVQGPGGGMNHLVVQDGSVWCDDASCPDKVCIYMGKQNLEGSLIVCLPNQMVVQVVTDR